MRWVNAWLVGLSAGLAGVGFGVGISLLAAAAIPWRAGDYRPGRDATAPAAETGPVAETPETRFSFETIRVGQTDSHEFEIRNAGTEPLEVARGATSCTCTVSDFEESEGGSSEARVIAPGAGTRLRVKWRGKGDGGPYRQSATVLTNDPRRPQITFLVEGTVVPSSKAVPDSVTLPRVAGSAAHRMSVRVFTFGAEPPEVESLSVVEETTAEFYSLASAPLTPGEIASETAATGGFRIDVEVRPGLPQGAVHQGIKAVFRMPDEQTLEIPVTGTVAGDFGFAGAAWDNAREAVMLGTVSSRAGLRTNLFVTVKGPHRSAVKLAVREVAPAWLLVEPGEPRPVGDGAVVRIPVSISIPPGSPAASHLGTDVAPTGSVVFDTGHPQMATLTLRVCVTVIP